MASNAAYHVPHPLLEPDQPAAVLDAELPRERLGLLPVFAVSDEHENRIDPWSTSERSVRTRSSGRLIAVSRPAQPTTNVVLFDAQLASNAAPSLVVGRAPLGEVEAVGNDDEAARRRDAERDEVVADFVADRDQSVGRRGRAAARRA